jgi:TRAP-type C4-dicarboxylate transport system permease small subunit
MGPDAALRHEDSAAHNADLDPEAPRPSEEAELGGESNPELLPDRQPWRSILHGIGVIEQVIGSVLLVIILVLVLGQVAARYVPGSWVWTGEVARLSMVWLTLVMAGYLAAHDRHIAIQVVDWVLAGRALAAVKLFVSIAVLVTCLVLLYAVYVLLTTDFGGVTPAAQIPLVFVNAVPLVGFALVALRAFLSIVLVDLPALVGRTESHS